MASALSFIIGYLFGVFTLAIVSYGGDDDDG